MVHFKRHIAKAISYRFVGTFTTVLITYFFTGNWVVSGSVGFVEMVIKPFNYFLHERFWYKFIRYGIINKEENNDSTRISSR